jgi:hypothetical protein
MSLLGFVFYVFFAAVQVGMYLGIRRQWMPVGQIAGVGIGLSLVLALAVSFSSGNTLIQALFVAVALGLLISGATLSMALYFQNREPQQGG